MTSGYGPSGIDLVRIKLQNIDYEYVLHTAHVMLYLSFSVITVF